MVVVIKLIGMYIITGALRSQQARTLLGHAMLLGSKGDHPKQPHNTHLFPFVGHKKVFKEESRESSEPTLFFYVKNLELSLNYTLMFDDVVICVVAICGILMRRKFYLIIIIIMID